MIRTLFTWAYDAELIERPVRFGKLFNQPSKATIRRATPRGISTFSAAEVHQLLRVSPQPMTTFILLALNCGYGQRDIADLPAQAAAEAVRTGVLSFDRPKTAIERSCVLWPRTRAALLRTANLDGGRAFLTSRNQPWVRQKLHYDERGNIEKATSIDSLALRFNKIKARAGITGRSFYDLRRTFRTVADETRDRNAIARIMGHEIRGIEDAYIDSISRDRLEGITQHVRRWLLSGRPGRACVQAGEPAE